jgi:hypothetical protein
LRQPKTNFKMLWHFQLFVVVGRGCPPAPQGLLETV